MSGKKPADSPAEGEPPAKRVKPNYTFNVNKALDKAHEVKNFKDIIALPPSALQGLSEKADELLKVLGIKTIEQLGNWQYLKLARSIVTLADLEEVGKRDPSAEMNINKALDREFETKSLTELVDAPVSAIEGLADWVDSHLAPAGIKSIKDLADWKYGRWASAMVNLAGYETADHRS